MAKNIKLAAVETPAVGASVIHLENAPFLTGKERTNLLCGHCGLVLCKGVSAESCMKKFSAPVQVLVRCPQCATHNRLPVQLEG
jgi:Zn finger protein HypA/HybF involved in hydrogenase expression